MPVAIWTFLMSPIGRYLAMAAGVAALAFGAWAYVHHNQAQIAALRAQLAQSKAQGVMQNSQSAAQSDAGKIIDQGRAKADVTVHIQQENSRAILSAPGAAEAVDPGLMSALVSGLCRYASESSDPQCAGLQQPHPAVVPPTGQGGADPRPDDWGYSSSARPSYGPT